MSLPVGRGWREEAGENDPDVEKKEARYNLFCSLHGLRRGCLQNPLSMVGGGIELAGAPVAAPSLALSQVPGVARV